MFLAIFLGVCALATPAAAAAVVRALPQPRQETQPHPDEAQPAPSQGSEQNAASVSPGTEPAQSDAQTQSPSAPPPDTKPAPETGKKSQPTSAQAGAKEADAKASASKAKATSKKRHHRKSGGTSSPAKDKKVVRNGGTADPVVQLAPGMSAAQVSSQRQSTADLLAVADNNLKQISSRQLSPSQEDSVGQTRQYMEQAKTAEEAGDLQRAHNLASKAVLLSDDLVKH
ncbi:MAG: hypothetical protein ACRD20_16515 [Terriglobales bacterium]